MSFKVGDKVRILKSKWGFYKDYHGDIATVVEIMEKSISDKRNFYRLDIDPVLCRWEDSDLELYEAAKERISFMKYLDWAAEQIAKWPKWKRDIVISSEAAQTGEHLREDPQGYNPPPKPVNQVLISHTQRTQPLKYGKPCMLPQHKVLPAPKMKKTKPEFSSADILVVIQNWDRARRDGVTEGTFKNLAKRITRYVNKRNKGEAQS